MARSRFSGWPTACAAVVFALVASHPWAEARAEEEADYDRNGIYVAARVAFGVPTSLQDPLEDFLELDPDGPQNVRSDARLGVAGQVGYRLHPRLAGEAEVEWINGFTGTIDNNVHIYKGYTLMAGANVKGYILTGRFQPFLLIGGGYVQTFVDKEPRPYRERGTHRGGYFRAGGGFDAYFTQHWALTLGVDYALTMGDSSVDEIRHVNVTLGALYRF